MPNEQDDDEAEAQVAVATEAIRGAVLRLLREGKVHPQLIVFTVARVAGELGASAALAGGQDAERLLTDLADVLREAGREQQNLLRAEMLPVAGNA